MPDRSDTIEYRDHFWTDEYVEALREANRPRTREEKIMSAVLTDSDNAKIAEQHFGLTTISIIDWRKKVKAGLYVPTDGSGTEWGRGFTALDQIIGGSPPPPPPPPGPTPSPVIVGPDANARHLTSLGLSSKGQVEKNFYLAGGYCNVNTQNVEVANAIIGPSNDSNIIVEDGASGAHLHDIVVHGCGTPRQHTWGDHGIYGSAAGILCERFESYGQGGFGQANSPRWYDSIYAWGLLHDSSNGIGCFDYSDGKNAGNFMAQLHAFLIMRKMTKWAGYIDTPRNSHSSGYQGPNTIPWEYFHATMDLRDETTVPFNLSGDPVDGGSSYYNCCLIYDGATDGWLHSPKAVNKNGTVVLSSADAAKFLESDLLTPKVVSGSPLLGKAVATTGRGHKTYGDFGDVGAVQLNA